MGELSAGSQPATPEQPPYWLADARLDLRDENADLLGVRPLADEVAKLIAAAPTPFTISLSGGWGVGKSTVAQYLCDLHRSAGLPACVVDAWVTDTRDLRRQLAIEVGSAIRGEDKRAQVANDLDKGLRLTRSRQFPAQIEFRGWGAAWKHIKEQRWAFGLAAAIFLGAVAAAAAIPGDPWNTIFKSVASTLAPLLLAAGLVTIITPSESQAPAAESVELASAFSDAVTQGNPTEPVLVVVDNLDRLSGAEALEALSQIRSLVEIEGSRCVFLVPIDRGKLVQHLASHFGTPDTPETAVADDYLQKFFGVEIRLADPEPLDLGSMSLREAKRILGDQNAEDVATAARVLTSAAGRSPRTVARLLNSLATRYRILAGRSDARSIGLPQLAFVEGLVAVAPAAIERLSREPRYFVQVRADFALATDDTERLQALSRLHGGEPNRPGTLDYSELRRYLVANADIILTASDLRMALTLREDRVWAGVDDPDPYSGSLEAGDTDAYLAALNARSDQAETVMDRSVYWIEARHNAGLSEQALLGVRAISGTVEMTSKYHTRLHHVATENLRLVSSGFVRSLGDATLRFIFEFAGRSHDGNRQKLADALANDINYLRQDEASIAPLVRALRYVPPELIKPEDLADTLRIRPDADLEALFEEPPVLTVAEKAVVDPYLQTIREWTPDLETPNHEQVVLYCDRLLILRRHGWSGAGLQSVAAVLEAHIAGFSLEEIGSTAPRTMLRLVDAADPSDEIDSLARALVQQEGATQARAFDAAFDLPVSPAAASEITDTFMDWAADAPADFGPVVDHHRALIEEARPTFRDDLIELWAEKGERAFARYAVQDDPDSLVARLEKGVNQAAEGMQLSRASEAIEIAHEFGGHKAAAALEDLIAGLLKALSPAELGEIDGLLDRMKSRRVPRARFVIRLSDAIVTAPPEVLSLILATVRKQASAFGPRQLREVSDALLDRYLSQSIGSAEDVDWLVRTSGDFGKKVEVTAQLIGRASISDGSRGVLADLSRVLRRSTVICEALVGKAHVSADEEEADQWLTAALDWRPPRKGRNTEFDDELASLVSRWPALRATAARLARDER